MRKTRHNVGPVVDLDLGLDLGLTKYDTILRFFHLEYFVPDLLYHLDKHYLVAPKVVQNKIHLPFHYQMSRHMVALNIHMD